MGTAAADSRRDDALGSIEDWMADRWRDVRRLGSEAEAAGHEALGWAARTGAQIFAPRPSDVAAVGNQYRRAQDAGAGPVSLTEVEPPQEIEKVEPGAGPDHGAPQPMDLGMRFQAARAGDNISRMIGSSDPRAIGKFLSLNGMNGRDSTIRAGRSYIVPTRWDDASAGEARAGQALLGTDNARLQALAERRAEVARQARPASASDASAQAGFQYVGPSQSGSVGAPQTSASAKRSSIGHPGFAESLIPVWGSGREAIADYQEGNYAGAALNGALAASDLFLAESVVKGIAKGGFYVARGAAKKAANPYSWKQYVRPWMGEEGRRLVAGQHGHHWLIPQKGWGKAVPEWFKNQPFNIMAMPDALTHMRLHHRVGDLPRFDLGERLWRGTPTWAKVAAGEVVGHPLAAAEAGDDQ